LLLPAARAVFASNPATRLFLDRQLAFWRELDPAWSLTEMRARVALSVEETHDVKTALADDAEVSGGHPGRLMRRRNRDLAPDSRDTRTSRG
jgi:hypothetical protein